MDGILLVDKPAGWTSHDVVAKVRSLLRQQAKSQKLKAQSSDKKLPTRDFQLSARGSKIRVGHAGTLDPMATGLLIILVGGYTKRAGEFLKLDKSYDCELTLGEVSTTGDAEGKISNVSDKVPTIDEIKVVIAGFIGTIKQTPPAYSAIKIKGQAAYKLARAGRELKMEPRVVTIYELRIINYQYPKLNFSVHVSSGTYIRSLATDIGAKLGIGAYLSALRRTKVGDFEVKNAIKTNDLTEKDISRCLQYL